MSTPTSLPSVPTLFVTLGDPLSINLWALSELLPRRDPTIAYVLLGDEKALARGASAELKQQLYHLSSPTAVDAPGLYFYPTTRSVPTADEDWERQLSPEQRGEVATAALHALRGIDWGDGRSDGGRGAVLTCPIDKKACHLAGFGFPGQTEFFEHLWQQPGIMILAGDKLKVGLVTNHLALKDVPAAITQEAIVAKGRAFLASLQGTFGDHAAPIAVCGLNPHCSDGGLFGDEDARILAPAVAELNQLFPGQFVGPVPADTAFFNAYEGRWRGVLAMYHDQGLAPLKTVHFFDAINITGGLAHLRVSPDHGPAADLFGRGQEANTDSFALALSSAERYLLSAKAEA